MSTYIMDKYGKYETSFLKEMFKEDNEFSLLSIISFYDKTLVKVEIKTYNYAMSLMDSLSIIIKSTKKRNPKTLEKAGVIMEDLLNGMEENESAKKISNYFIEHSGIIVSINTDKKVNLLNKLITNNNYKEIDCITLDMSMMLKKFNIDISDNDNIKNLKDDFKLCIRQFKRVQSIEQNKRACVVKYAFYWENKNRNNQKWIMCDTSLGRIYYDTIFHRWDMTQKERKSTGLIIDHFDIKDVESQLLKKYRFKNLNDLVTFLYEKSLEREFDHRQAGNRE